MGGALKESFLIKVQFKQNATWQGTIAWIEGDKVQSFRSTLEMLKLMDSAISRNASRPGWDE